MAFSTALSRLPSTATRPSSGSRAIVWPLLHLLAADRRVPDGLRHLDRLDASTRLGHRPGVGGRVERRIEREQGGDALGGVARRHDDEPLVLADLGRLFGGEPDVRVVRQEQDLAGAGEAGDPEQLAGARVRGLAAAHDLVDAERFEDASEAVAGHDGHDRRSRPERRVGRLRRSSTVSAASARARAPWRAPASVPVNSVARASRMSRAWLSRFSTLIRLRLPWAQAVADHLVGALVVDVDLERPRVARDEDGLADRLEVVADRVEVEGLAGVRLEQVHRLVAEALVGVGNQRRRLRAGPCPAGSRAGRGPAEEMEQRALEQPVDALPARVDDAGLAQDREQRRRPGDRLLGRLDGRR